MLTSLLSNQCLSLSTVTNEILGVDTKFEPGIPTFYMTPKKLIFPTHGKKCASEQASSLWSSGRHITVLRGVVCLISSRQLLEVLSVKVHLVLVGAQYSHPWKTFFGCLCLIYKGTEQCMYVYVLYLFFIIIIFMHSMISYTFSMAKSFVMFYSSICNPGDSI